MELVAETCWTGSVWTGSFKDGFKYLWHAFNIFLVEQVIVGHMQMFVVGFCYYIQGITKGEIT